VSRKPTPTSEARDLRALLAVVLDAITLPYDTPDYDERIKERAGLAKVVIRDGLDVPDRIGWNADWLRSKLTAEQAEADERVKNRCRRCHKPFDPADTTFDGRARHNDSPWCRSCVDNSHDGGTEHVCVICDPKRYGGTL
jgi:hypothetical protein